MIMKMKDMMKRKNGQKGFTLIELIVVMAILAILAAIAVPKYVGIQDTAKVKADGSTAMAIIHAARLQEGATGNKLSAMTDFKDTYMDQTVKPQSGGTFALTKDGDDYIVTWTPTDSASTYEGKLQTVKESEMGIWKINEIKGE